MHQLQTKVTAYLQVWVRHLAFLPRLLSSDGAATGAASVGHQKKSAINARVVSIDDVTGSVGARQRKSRKESGLTVANGGGLKSGTKLSMYCDAARRSIRIIMTTTHTHWNVGTTVGWSGRGQEISAKFIANMNPTAGAYWHFCCMPEYCQSQGSPMTPRRGIPDPELCRYYAEWRTSYCIKRRR